MNYKVLLCKCGGFIVRTIVKTGITFICEK